MMILVLLLLKFCLLYRMRRRQKSTVTLPVVMLSVYCSISYCVVVPGHLYCGLYLPPITLPRLVPLYLICKAGYRIIQVMNFLLVNGILQVSDSYSDS